MSQIRSKWTKQEKIIHNYLKARKIKHKMHPNIYGHPDILLSDTKTAVFLQGCFWHKCPQHYIAPKSNKKYWLAKIQNNVKRDAKAKKILKSKSYKVLAIWEHEIKDVRKVLSKIAKYG
jgi:DNA mismatch endonuclease (patch repair protein)